MPTPQGTPEAPRDTAIVAPDAVEDALETDLADRADDTPETDTELDQDIEPIKEEDVLALAIPRSVRPPAARPSEDTFGAPDGAQDTTQQPGDPTAAQAQRTGLDILAEAGNAALYGRSSLNQARATGNATETNYAGRVFQQLNRSLRVFKIDKGSAVLRFQIMPDGQVGWVRIIRSQGSPNIEVAAAANVRKAAPFPRPPDGKPFEIRVTFQSR